jgi:NAD(P)H-dependent flavin oxidoreductase YrpB (nitropropane dioxygenase family)
VAADIARAAREDDAERGELNFGQSAGLIDGIDSCGDVVRGLTAEAEEVLREAGRFLS